MAKKDQSQVPHSSSLRWIPISELKIDPQAQRAFRPLWVKARAGAFDAEQLGYIVVNRRADGKHYVIDGQHRVGLLREVGWGDQQIQCECFENLTQAQEAELFLARNDRITVRTYDKFRVAVTAGEEIPVDIDRIVHHQGLTISDQATEGHITAVVALQKVYTGSSIASAKEGPAALARTLRVIQRAWGKSPSTFHGQIIHGMGLVQLRYNGKVNQDELADKLAPFAGGAPGILGKAKAIQDMRGRPMPHCVASVIVDTYNKGRSKGKIQDWWA